MQCCGQEIKWNHIVQLYERNTGSMTTTPGLSIVHKLKYEHVYLNNFSKMRVDLAAQVCQIINFCITYSLVHEH